MLQKVKGFRDIFGEDIKYWHMAESLIQSIFKSYGFSEFRLPVLEKTSVYKRGIGETTDIVEKEMFTFTDSDELVSLRPEGTASLMRAYIENNLHNPPGIKKYYYLGNMFRRERPQKGRFRQFSQIGVERDAQAIPTHRGNAPGQRDVPRLCGRALAIARHPRCGAPPYPRGRLGALLARPR